ncbi:MAG: hypothetical protein WEB87_04085 [Bacteriovoracaceae bacterium]
MKLFILVIAFAGLVHGRQYIQCAAYDSWDRAVINLDGKNSTLFLTNGVHRPDEVRVLKNLFHIETNDSRALFETRGSKVVDMVRIPLEFLDVRASNFEVVIGHRNMRSGYESERTLSCFSAIYEK